MISFQLIASAAPSLARSFRHWIFSLGGLGFIPLGLLDSSVIPLPGSMDVLTIVLAAGHPQLWFYYAGLATVGSVIGGYVTYRLARKGGKESLERRVKAKRLKKVYALFERWGFAAVAIPALLPPPMPLVPFLLAAGALQYSVKKFLVAMALGRIIRFTILAYLAARYGRKMLPFISKHGIPVLLAALGLTAASLVIYFFVRRTRNKKPAKG